MSRLLAFAALCVACSLTACLPTAPLEPVTPANTAQVNACEGIASQHNAWVVGDIVISGLGTTAAGIGAGLSSTTTGLKDGITAGAAVAGGLAMAGAGLVALTASSFANSHCSDVVGALPLTVPAPFDVQSVDAAPPPGDAGGGG